MRKGLILKSAILLLLALSMGIFPSNAETTVSLNLDGSVASYVVQPGDTTSRIVFTSRSTGKETLPFSIAVYGPVGADVRGSSASEKAQASSVTQAPSLAAPSSAPLAQAFLSRSVENELFSGSITKSQHVALLSNSNESDVAPFDDTYGEYGTLQASGLIRKDTCNKKSLSYAVTIVVDLSAVDRSAYPDGITVQAAALASRFHGSKQASLKELGDGKFPEPLLLMSSLGGYAGEAITMSQWRNERLIKVTSVKIEDYVYHKGRVLTRSRLGKLIRSKRGAKVTFEIFNSSAAYGVCFQLVARRQKANGY